MSDEIVSYGENTARIHHAPEYDHSVAWHAHVLKQIIRSDTIGGYERTWCDNLPKAVCRGAGLPMSMLLQIPAGSHNAGLTLQL